MAERNVAGDAGRPNSRKADARPTRPFSHRYPDASAELPANGRYLNSLAERAGLDVSHSEADGWCWAGARDQFEASGIFPASTNWSFCRREFSTSDGLHAAAWQTDGRVRLLVHEFLSRSRRVRSDCAPLRRAAADEGWQRFRESMLQPVPLIEDQAVVEPARKGHRRG